MFLKTLGCGTIKSPHDKNCSAFLINNEVLLDCGPGTWRTLGLNKISVRQLSLIVISHFHPDHVNDLAAILLQLYLEKPESEITIAGPSGLKNWLRQFMQLYGDWFSKLKVDLIELATDTFSCGGYQIQSAPTLHTENSICIKIIKNHKSVFYSGDSDYNQNLIRLAKNCDLAIVEASHTEETKIEGHMTPRLAAEVAQQAAVKRLVLTHMYPEVKKIDITQQMQPVYNGKFIVAEDNMEIQI